MHRCFRTRLTKRSFNLLSTLWVPDGSMRTIYKILNTGVQTARDVRGREQLLWGSDRGDSNEQKLGLRVKVDRSEVSRRSWSIIWEKNQASRHRKRMPFCSISLSVSFLTANNKGNHTGWQYATTGNIAEGD